MIRRPHDDVESWPTALSWLRTAWTTLPVAPARLHTRDIDGELGQRYSPQFVRVLVGMSGWRTVPVQDICRHPTKTMVVFENYAAFDASLIANVVGVIASNHGQFGMGKGDNFLFVDGHVKYYLVDEKQFRWRHYGDPFWDYNDTIRDY